MKANQVVGLVLGLILILLALIAMLTGSIDIETQTGAISLLAAVLLGIFVILSSIKQKAPAAPQQRGTCCPGCGTPVQPDFVACPKCGAALPPADLPPPPTDYVPPPGQKPAPGPAEKPMKSQALVVAVMVVVVVVLMFYIFGGSILGLGAKWSGTCTYYSLDIYGTRDSRITGDCQMTLKVSGDSASGTLDITPVSQVDVGDPGYVPAPEEHISFSGDYDGTHLSFYTEMTFGPGAGTAKDHWEFTITGNSMVGKVTNLDTYAYIGLDSDTGGFTLSK